MVTQIIYSIIVAIVYGLASYFKESDLEKFSIPAFLKTLVIALIVAFVMFEGKMTYDAALQFVVSNAFLTTFIDKIINNLLKWKPQPIVNP